MTGPSQRRAEEAAGGPRPADRPAGLVRLTTFSARPGRAGALLEAAMDNAEAARRATGCRSAEVCTAPEDPDTVLVVSRWESDAALRAFLGWHERLAHGAVSPHAAGPPHSVHYPVVSGPS